jgi:hypothetical protein
VLRPALTEGLRQASTKQQVDGRMKQSNATRKLTIATEDVPIQYHGANGDNGGNKWGNGKIFENSGPDTWY